MPALATVTAIGHPYPLIRGGGLFLICIGLCLLLGWLLAPADPARPHRWIPFVVAGFAVGLTASGLSALLPSLGRPTFVHIGALIGAIAVEMGLIYLVVRRYIGDGRKLILGILFVVGLHFIVMGLAHGPLIVLLGVVTAINAGVAFRAPGLPLRAAGVVDSLLKVGFGVWMFALYPAATFL